MINKTFLFLIFTAVLFISVPSESADWLNYVEGESGEIVSFDMDSKTMDTFSEFKDIKFDVIYCDPPWSFNSKKTGGSMSSGASQKYDVMTLAGHANFATTHKFYLAVADDLIARARRATTHQVSQELLQKCCQDSQKGATL